MLGERRISDIDLTGYLDAFVSIAFAEIPAVVVFHHIVADIHKPRVGNRPDIEAETFESFLTAAAVYLPKYYADHRKEDNDRQDCDYVHCI